MHGKFEIPYLFQIDIAELEEELNLEIGKMYYSIGRINFIFIVDGIAVILFEKLEISNLHLKLLRRVAKL